MQKLSHRFWFGPVVSGILMFIALCEMNFWMGWVCCVPLFISISGAKPAAAFTKGFVFGAVFSFTAFFWMIPGAQRFTGGSISYGVIVIIISLLLLSLYHGCLMCCFAMLKKEGTQPRSMWRNAMLMACITSVGEALLLVASGGLPWFVEQLGTALAGNLYAIQPAALFGVSVMSFVVALVNYLIAFCIVNKQYQRLYIPAVVFAAYMLIGAIMLSGFKPSDDSKPFSVAILAENLPPELRWNDSNANALAQGLVDLTSAAVTLKPNMMLWSECAIPWTYQPGDALIKEVLRISKPTGATQMLGINTAGSSGEKAVFNSAYCMTPDGAITGRYYKQYLLALIERPVYGWMIPFLSTNGYAEKTDDQYSVPLQTPYGKAGVMMCNESIIPAAAARVVNGGAQFLVNMSNDGWFNDTYMVRVHYLKARIRAVEARKDMVINSNSGYSGLIKASGEMESIKRSDEPFVEAVTVQPNNEMPLVCKYPNLFVYSCISYLLFIIGMKGYRKYIVKSKSAVA